MMSVVTTSRWSLLPRSTEDLRHWPGLDFRVLYCHYEHMAPVKEQRLQIRVDPRRKQMLEEAAEATHQNLSAFVLQAASRQAEEVLAERPLIALPAGAAAAFSEALANPGEVNERLGDALRRPRRFRWID